MSDPDELASEDFAKPTNGTKARSGIEYPYFGLRTCIGIVQAVRKAGGSEATNASVMAEMGVAKTTDRQWAYGIPAAIQFGLIERVGRGDDGKIRLTDLASRIALPTTSEEGNAARVASFKTPELYSRLIERFAGHPVPLKDGLRNLLHREFHIVESMAPKAAEAFLESLEEAGLTGPGGDILATVGPAAHDATKVAPREAPAPNTSGTKAVQVPQDFVIYRCKISNKRIIEIALPPEFTRADVKRLTAFLETQVDDPEDEADTAIID